VIKKIRPSCFITEGRRVRRNLQVPDVRSTRPTAVSLFTGCGGSDRGLIDAGFDIVMANDIFTYAKETYEANLPATNYILGDVREIKSFPKADLLAGCYPCQGFSQGGVRDASRTINYLYQEFGRALRQIKPKAFIVENVSGMVRTDFNHLLRNQLKNFRHAGYKVDWRLLNAADYGVPQERRRIIIVGLRADLNVSYQFPLPTHGLGCGQPYVSIRQALRGMRHWPRSGVSNEPFHWYYMSRNRRRDWDEIAPTIVSRDRHVPLHPASPPLVYLGKDKYAFEHGGPARRFSVREAAILQGFGRNFVLPDGCGNHSRYKVIGNAVPPPLFKAVAQALPDIF
jgi:DNA (cytosine-5)-methyltransferase 1